MSFMQATPREPTDLMWLERRDDDFPYYRGLPVEITPPRWWVVMAAGGGTFTVQQLSNGRYMDAHESSSNDFSVVTGSAQNNDTQRWIITPV